MITIDVSSDSLVVRVRSTTATLQTVTSTVSLGDGGWHDVLLQLRVGGVLLSVDNVTTCLEASCILSWSSNSLPPTFAFGSLAGLSGNPSDAIGFKGCIRSVAVDSQPIDLQSALQVTSQFSFSGQPLVLPATGCPRDNMCFAVPCTNMGTCSSTWSGYQCRCQSNFEGQQCQQGNVERIQSV